jgi:hypothetical protein
MPVQAHVLTESSITGYLMAAETAPLTVGDGKRLPLAVAEALEGLGLFAPLRRLDGSRRTVLTVTGADELHRRRPGGALGKQEEFHG